MWSCGHVKTSALGTPPSLCNPTLWEAGRQTKCILCGRCQVCLGCSGYLTSRLCPPWSGSNQCFCTRQNYLKGHDLGHTTPGNWVCLSSTGPVSARYLPSWLQLSQPWCGLVDSHAKQLQHSLQLQMSSPCGTALWETGPDKPYLRWKGWAWVVSQLPCPSCLGSYVEKHNHPNPTMNTCPYWHIMGGTCRWSPGPLGWVWHCWWYHCQSSFFLLTPTISCLT